MKPCELQRILSREWNEEGQHRSWSLSPEARVITGSPRLDAQLHRILNEYGVEIEMDFRFTTIENYSVVDEEKFAWFLLRWA
jgi:hypothetical protein